MIFICSPYSGDIASHTEITRKLCRQVVLGGETPFAPHLLYTQFLDDNDPGERQRGIECGIDVMTSGCDEMLVYTGKGISKGMRQEIYMAHDFGIPIVYINALD